MFGSSGQVRVWVGFGPLICGFFGFGLFQIQAKKIVFMTQNFRAGLDRVYGLGEFWPCLVSKLECVLKKSFTCTGRYA